MLLRGLCSVLAVRVRYLDVFTPFARLALIDRFDRVGHAKSIVYQAGLLKPNKFELAIPHHQFDDASNLQATLAVLMKRLYAEGLFVGAQVEILMSR